MIEPSYRRSFLRQAGMVVLAPAISAALSELLAAAETTSTTGEEYWQMVRRQFGNQVYYAALGPPVRWRGHSSRRRRA